MPETLDFVAECGRQWNVKITWLEYRPDAPLFEVVGHNSASRNGEPFAALIRKRRYTPSPVQRYCSDVLKYRTAKRFLLTLGYKKWTSTIGFRGDEPTRVEKIRGRRHSRESIWLPLFEAGVSKHDVQKFWDEQAFNLALTSAKGKTPLGNCDGCFLKSEKNLANLCRNHPEKAEWWNQIEQETGKTFNKNRSWKELIDVVARSPQLDFENDPDGFFCESSHGSCEGY